MITSEFSVTRRFSIALISLAAAALLFRSQLSEALVIRGDDYLYRGDRTQALERYHRAIAISPLSGLAVDRYVFVNLQTQTPEALEDAVNMASRYLHLRPNDAVVRADRALCYLHERRYAAAQVDFERAASMSNVAADYVFAGWAAQRAGHESRARALWKEALTVQPGFQPALVALSGRKS